MSERIVCRILTGPTASGKSEAAIELAVRHGWAVACMDSMQIYRRMDIGTAKPSKEDREKADHFLLDIREPDESFSVSEYRDMAEQLVTEQMEQHGRGVLFVGGTGLYMQALMHPMSMGSVPADEEIRCRLKAEAEEPGGKERLHKELNKLDPATAARLPVNDVRRVIRAIEVTLLTGIPFSGQPDRTEESPFIWKTVSTVLPREILYERINLRVGRMIENGLKQEVAALLESGVPPEAQSMAGLGYKEMIPCVKGEITIEEAAERIRLGTRHYAKRQMTFLRREKDIAYVDMTEAGAIDRIDSLLTGMNTWEAE